MGPMSDPSTNDVKLREFFPFYHRKKIIVSVKKFIDLEYMIVTFRVFCFATSPK